MEDPQIKIRVAETAVGSSATRGKRSSLPWLLTGVALVTLVCAIGIALIPAKAPEPQPPAISEPLTPSTGEPLAKSDSTPQVEPTFADDGKSLWVSPTDGEPIDCSYLLPGTQLVLHVRMADLLSHDEGAKMLASLGPWGQKVVKHISDSTGIELGDVETLLVGLRTTRDGSLDFSARFRLNRPFEAERIRPNCFLPAADEGRAVVWSTRGALAELKEQAGEPPLFARELDRVLKHTDADRIVTLAFAGKFLQISGEKFLQGAGEQLQTSIVDFLGDEATATSLSAHWDENFFLELQSTVALNERPHRFAALLEKRVAESSEKIEDRILAEQWHPYGRKVLARFPAMLRKLGNYTRSGEADKLCLLRCYLPVNAGHNLLMATELLLNSSGLDSNVASAQVASTREQAHNVVDRLQQTTSLVFPKETLERALEMLSEDLGVPIQIAGRDLQLEGITKNQSFAIELRDRPADEILLAVLLQANPDRTASGPTDTKQKLVYVVRETTNGDSSVIVVTTRSAAGQRGEKLPVVFQPPAR